MSGLSSADAHQDGQDSEHLGSSTLEKRQLQGTQQLPPPAHDEAVKKGEPESSQQNTAGGR